MTGIPSWARVGAKVVCVRAPWLPQSGPSPKDVCQVAEVAVDRGGVWLYLDGHSEWVQESATKRARHSYGVNCFRPLITQEDDIKAHFALLLETSTPVEA